MHHLALETQRIFLVLSLLFYSVCSFLSIRVTKNYGDPLLQVGCDDKIGQCLFWSRNAEIFQSNNDGAIPMENEFDVSDSASTFIIEEDDDDGNISLESPRDWLEWQERRFGQDGAYTVLRCDFFPTTDKLYLWGQEYHKMRLIESICLLTELQQNQSTLAPHDSAVTQALRSTDQLIGNLLKKTQESIQTLDCPLESAITAMLTVLWTPQSGCRVRVQGHIFHSEQLSVPSLYKPNSINACLAMRTQSENENLFINRYEHIPQAKVSSWCRTRRQLEMEFKSDDVGEVILTRKNEGIELLEGLTSNLFVVYQDGTLRTAPTDFVLGGYSRHLILEHAKQLGVRVVEKSILLSEVDQWKEVFMSSAIRIIIPVSRVVCFDNSKTDNLWNDSESENDPIWGRLFLHILNDSLGTENEWLC